MPKIQFAKSAGANIVWQQFGSGPDVVAIPPLCSNVEIIWENPYYRRFLHHLGAHVRITAFDKRGIGMSDTPGWGGATRSHSATGCNAR